MKQLDKIVALLTEINNKLLPVGHHLLPAEQKNMEWNINALLTRMAVVSKLGISERTYNRWVKSGILIPICLGNKHYYREQDLQDALKRSVNRGLI